MTSENDRFSTKAAALRENPDKGDTGRTEIATERSSRPPCTGKRLGPTRVAVLNEASNRSRAGVPACVALGGLDGESSCRQKVDELFGLGCLTFDNANNLTL